MTETVQENVVDRKDLKIMHYKQKLANLEEDNADLRVELTVQSQQLQDALAELKEYKERDAQNKVPTEED